MTYAYINLAVKGSSLLVA